MAKVNIRGIGLTKLSREVAKEILDFKNDRQYNASDKFTAHGMDFEKRDIGGIVLDDFEEDDRASSSNRKEENDEYYEIGNKSYLKAIEMRCRMPVPEKARDIAIYELIVQAYTGNKATPEFRQEVTKRQFDYFCEHPKFPYAGINIQDLIPKHKTVIEESVLTGLGDHVVKRMYHVMSEGLRTAKKLGYA